MNRASRILALCACVVWLSGQPASSAPPVDWVRGGTNDLKFLWGIRGHLLFAISPTIKGPRGLVRLLYPTLPEAKYDLINFIAVEPIVKQRRGYSELEHSQLDNLDGKRFWVEAQNQRGSLKDLAGGEQILEVPIFVEPFQNGACVQIIIRQSSLRPDEIALETRSLPGGAAMDFCILTATMGNKARARQLWLKDGAVTTRALYGDFQGHGQASGFAPRKKFPLQQLITDAAGDTLASITTEEAQPNAVHPFPGTDRWYYGGFPVVQYWKKAKGTARNDLVVSVNARYTYWGTDQPLPGGAAFENFEFEEKFHPGQQFIFGIKKVGP